MIMQWMLLPLKRYAEFSGRSRRKEYWMFVLFTVLVYTAFVLLAVALGTGAALGADSAASVTGMLASFGVMAVAIGIFWLVTLIPGIAVVVRRLHDTDRTGWWIMAYIGPYIVSTVLTLVGAASANQTLTIVGTLISIVGLIGAVVLLVFMCLDGTRGPNRFGSDPKGRDLADVFA